MFPSCFRASRSWPGTRPASSADAVVVDLAEKGVRNGGKIGAGVRAVGYRQESVAGSFSGRQLIADSLLTYRVALVYGSSAIYRARLIALATFRCSPDEMPVRLRE